MANVRVVSDTNVYVSALLWTGNPHRLLHLAEMGDLTLVTTPAIMDELREVLERPKFKVRIRNLQTSVAELMESLLRLEVGKSRIKIHPDEEGTESGSTDDRGPPTAAESKLIG